MNVRLLSEEDIPRAQTLVVVGMLPADMEAFRWRWRCLDPD